MAVCVLSIGTELTRGELVNTNAAWLGEELTKLGFEVVEHVVVDDDLPRLAELVARLAKRHDVVVATGGLGPTTDDLTAEAVARAMGVELERDPVVVDAIAGRFRSFGREMPASNAKQADFPSGAVVLPNPIGTAPGFSVELHGARLFFTPGVPREMKQLFQEEIAPAIADLAEPRTHQLHLRTFGMTESAVGQALHGLEDRHDGLTLGYRAHFPEIEVKVHVRAESSTDAESRAEEIAEEVRGILGEAVFGGREDSFPEVVGRALKAAGARLAIAESCTGGRVAAMLTAVPGASAYLTLGVVAYANSAKEQVLGVRPETLQTHGAVSAETAKEMAEGALSLADADIAIAITGIAGPEGGTEEKPVGTVWFGLAQRGKPSSTVHRQLPWGRERTQTVSAYIALELVRRAALGRDLDLARL